MNGKFAGENVNNNALLLLVHLETTSLGYDSKLAGFFYRLPLLL